MTTTAVKTGTESRTETDSESDVRRHELAQFLRSRRERITPEQVGLPCGRRRRTPGLRREEVAHLSAVGVTWYTWLEQARDIQVSPQVLDALARALLLDATERTHLFALAGAVDPAPGTPCPTVTPALRQMLGRLEPLPACVQNSRYDILAYNRTYGRLLCDLDALPREERNCIWLAFTHPEWRAAVAELPDVTRAMAGKFRASMAEHLAEPAWKALLHRLEAASPEFREIWARHEVVAQGGRTKIIRNARVGPLHLEHTNLWLGPSSGPRLVTYVPMDEESRAGLERLHALALEEPVLQEPAPAPASAQPSPKSP
ncbi:helix-turn-helix domain-containing protein [Streptomyces sp. QHH-9511]|uniref:MmyB family transcriptional regulator n=1 Tax=Streptomyces sp. QHH-9511 TaxID=2684468 RepID=UPI00131948AA|nr:helix-turn-helix domain-containing protein [Streptomyces sp. QHH-9511]QGZ48838.1 helix-turn-helix domain-containing protein [Streptomyces sp. QHH-9511]